MIKSCFWSSLNKDLNETGKCLLLVSAMILIVAMGAFVCWALYIILAGLISSFIWPEWNAVNVFRFGCAFILIFHAWIVLRITPKDQLKDVEGRKVGKSVTYTIVFTVIILCFFGFYCESSYFYVHLMVGFIGDTSKLPYPNVWFETIISLIWVTISTPFYFAYRRCKE